VLLGKPQTVTSAIEKITIHPDWNSNTDSYDADITILTLKSEVIFNDFIQPICLMNPESELASITKGISLVFGDAENARYMNGLKAITTPIHSNEDCFLANAELAKLSSKRTFCGGYANGTGPCFGDSGAPVLVSNDNIYYLRGITSASLIKWIDSNPQCDKNSYSVYTNVLKFSDWINSIITSDLLVINSGNENKTL
jgi:hypothetical protein